MPLSDEDKVQYGAYVIAFEEKRLDAILIATGSEVGLAYQAKEALKQENIDVRVVSMPSFYLFEQQSKEYQEEILPSTCQNRLAIEMASEFGWHKYAIETLCMLDFGRS